MATASLTAVVNELAKRKGRHGNGGAVNCRPFRIDGVLRPDKGWSEHAYGNADDWMINGFNAQKPFVDELGRMKTQGFPVGKVLWAGNRPNDHSDHIHIEGAPSLSKPGVKPPCAGGKEPTPTSILDIDLATFQAPTGSGVPLSGQGMFAPINLPIIGDIGISWGAIAFSLIAIVVAILMVQFLGKALADKTGVTEAVKKVATKGLA